MENQEKQLENLEKILDQCDEWLIKYGYIPNHAHNRVIERLATEVKGINPGDIEYYVDLESRRIDLTVRLSLWHLLFLWVFGLRLKKLAEIIDVVEEVLVGYEIRAVLARRGKNESNNVLSPSDADANGTDGPGESKLQDSQDILPDQEESPEDQ